MTMVKRRGALRLPVNGEEISVPSAVHLRCPKCGEIVLRFLDAKRLHEDAIAIYRKKHALLSADDAAQFIHALARLGFGRDGEAMGAKQTEHQPYRSTSTAWHLKPRMFDRQCEKTFDFYAEKDRLMTHEADIGPMIWDGKSTGTLLNVTRLLRQRKKVVVYNVRRRRFSELRNLSEWAAFVSGCDAEIRRKVEEKVAIEDRVERPIQQSLPT